MVGAISGSALALRARTWQEGSMRRIVQLDSAGEPEARFAPRFGAQQRTRIRTAQDGALAAALVAVSRRRTRKKKW